MRLERRLQSIYEKVGLIPLIAIGTGFLLLLIIILIVIVKSSENVETKKRVKVSVVEEKVIEIEDPDRVLTGAIVKLEPFVINLRSNLRDSPQVDYLNLNITLEFFQFYPPETLDLLLPKIRDAIITTVSSKSSREVIGKANQEALREELIEVINQHFSLDNRVVNIYFNSIIVQ